MRRPKWMLLLRPATPAPAPGEPAPFDATARGEWAWVQPLRFRPAWDLVVDGAVVGRLALRGVMRHAAEMHVAGATWTFRPRFPGDVLVTAAGAAAPCARFRMGWLGGGRIEREGRDTLRLRRESFWGLRWALVTGEQLPLVHLHAKHGLVFVREGARLELEDAARRLEDLPMLLALAWFQVLHTRRSHVAHGGG